LKISSLLKGGGGKEGHTKNHIVKVSKIGGTKSHMKVIWDLLENILS
jgi:hypothetical protein